MNTVKTLLSFAVMIAILASCRKSPVTPVRQIPSIVPPKISVSENVRGCRVMNNSNFTRPLDSLQKDTAFVLYRQENEIEYLPINLFFGIKLERGVLNQVSWTIGFDTTERQNPSIQLFFREPVGSILIKAVVTWTPLVTAIPQVDTVSQIITINNAQNNLIASYRGVDASNVLDTFVININEFNNNYDTLDSFKYFGIQNLYKDFPYNLPINIYSSGFGLCTAPFPFPQRYNIGNKFISQPFGLGSLSSDKDSIYIYYSFVEYGDGFSFNNIRTFERKFIGKKL